MRLMLFVRVLTSRSAARNQGLRLVFIPYWWDGTESSLVSVFDEQFPGYLIMADSVVHSVNKVSE